MGLHVHIFYSDRCSNGITTCTGPIISSRDGLTSQHQVQGV